MHFNASDLQADLERCLIFACSCVCASASECTPYHWTLLMVERTKLLWGFWRAIQIFILENIKKKYQAKSDKILHCTLKLLNIQVVNWKGEKSPVDECKHPKIYRKERLNSININTACLFRSHMHAFMRLPESLDGKFAWALMRNPIEFPSWQIGVSVQLCVNF